MNPKTKAAEILIIDENNEHSERIKNVFISSKTVSNLRIFNNYIEGLEYVREIEKYLTGRPDIVITDIKTSVDGNRFEVIREIKSNPDLAHIPVIVFSGNDSPDVISKCYSMNVSSYISKPEDEARFKKAVENIESFWFSTAKLSFLH